MVFDFDLEFLKEVAHLVDAHLARLDGKSMTSDDPDQFGVLDRIEYVLGFGFVASQQYITAICSMNRICKSKALDCGPSHHCGKSTAAIVNAAANYWKHASEWTGDDKEQNTRATLSKLGVDVDEHYVLTAVLHKLLPQLPFQFDQMLPSLVSWRDEVRQLNTKSE